MKVNGKHYRTVSMEQQTIYMINQNLLPFKFEIVSLNSLQESCEAINNMIVRGAGAIGSAAGFALAQAALKASKKSYLQEIEFAKKAIENTRPTAQNLFSATNFVFKAALESPEKAYHAAQNFAQRDVDACRKIGINGNSIITSNMCIATHCNAGWLAFTDYGSALSPIYEAKNLGKKPFVYVDETRPRGQGARLTAWELQQESVPHRIIVDNAAAFFMQRGEIDMYIVGADRIAINGDTANKIGTLEKAIVAYEFGIPFYVAAPISTIDFSCKSGKEIPIEFRSEREVLYQSGFDKEGIWREILIASPNSMAINPAFDVTPAQYITGYITEYGILSAEELTDYIGLDAN